MLKENNLWKINRQNRQMMYQGRNVLTDRAGRVAIGTAKPK
jgi:hypothetical protein